MPAELAQKFGKDKATEFIGTGPYKFVEHLPDRTVKLARFDKYVAREDADRRPRRQEDSPTSTRSSSSPFQKSPCAQTASAPASTTIGDSLAPDSYARIKGVPNVEADIGKPYYWAAAYFNKKEGVFSQPQAAPGGPGRPSQSSRLPPPRSASRSSIGSIPSLAAPETPWFSDVGKDVWNKPDPGEGEGAPEGGRLRRHADPLALHQGVLLQLQRRRGLQAAAGGRRLQGRCAGHGLGHPDQAALRPEGVRRLHHRHQLVHPPDPARRSSVKAGRAGGRSRRRTRSPARS